MKYRWIRRTLPIAVLAVALLSFGCAKDPAGVAQQPAAAAPQQESNVLTGSIIGKSNKAQSVSIEVGKGADAVAHLLKFDDSTVGLEYAETGEAAIITWEQRGNDKFATIIKPKLATLPEGVTEIKADELNELLEQNVPVTIVDARPEMRYHQAHLPGAINVPVPLLKEKGAEVLPEDKDRMLVFYCGGYT